MKPKLAVWKFSSCDGCQLSLLDCEEELLQLAGAVQIAHFLEASRATRPGPYDLSLVEGSISTAREQAQIRWIREQSRQLVTIGACATVGGIQALRNLLDFDEVQQQVYPQPDFIDSLATATPVSDHVKVDFELRGCPIDRCPPWRAKRRRVVPGSREATRDTRRAEGAKGDPKGASERGVQSYGRPVCSRNELAMLWRNAG